MTNLVRTLAFVATALTLLLMAVATPAAAHATIYSPDGKIKFVYGNLNEPAYTYTKTGLDLIISDNTTGGPINGLDTDARAHEDGEEAPTPKITVLIRYGAEGGPTKDISNDFRAQHGKPGGYTHPITYTRPGLYYVVISGTINGTTFDNFALAPAHPVEDLDDSMWPDTGKGPMAMEERVSTIEDHMGTMDGHMMDDGEDGGSAPGLGPVLIIAGIAIIALRFRRR